MADDHTVRGKMVRLRGIGATVRDDGSVDLDIDSPIVQNALTEQQALDLYQVLADVIEYGPGDGSGTTEGTVNREQDRDD